MMLRLYSIYDRKMCVYLTPFPARGEVDATRQISASFSNPQMRETPVVSHPEDFDLVHVGMFDDESGEIERVKPAVVTNLARLARVSAADQAA